MIRIFLFVLLITIAKTIKTQVVLDSVSISYFLSQIETNHDVYFIYESALLSSHKVLYPLKVTSTLKGSILYLDSYSGLDVHKISEKTYAIRSLQTRGLVKGLLTDEQRRPLVGATVFVKSLGQGVATSLDGKYSLSLPSGDWKINYGFVGSEEKTISIALSAGHTVIQNVQLGSASYLEEVTIIGSRISPSTVIDNATLVTIINSDKEKKEWFSTLSELLQYNIPSFHSTSQTISDGTDHINPAALRGLGPDQVLVLINGKRRHQSALVNINGTVGKGAVATDLDVIPISAIDRIEVLQDGAAVQYGSDAIAGVINIILKEESAYSEAIIKSGISHKGDGAVLDISGRYGFALTKEGGHMDVSLNFLSRGAMNRSDPYSGLIFGDLRDEDAIEVTKFHEQTGFDNNRIMSVGNAAISTASLFFNMGLPLAAGSKFKVFGGLSYKNGISSGFYRLPHQVGRQSGIFPYGFGPKLDSDITDGSISVGFTKKVNDWKIEISNTTGRNGFDLRVLNSNNASLGLNSPTNAFVGGFSYTQNTTNIDAQVQRVNEAPINIGVGAEYRIESYEQHAGEEASWQDYGYRDQNGLKEAGFQMFPGFRPDNNINRRRHNLGLYANIEWEMSTAFKIGTATRFEQYSDFGNTLTARLYGRMILSEQAVIKASFNTGFRAPSLPQIYFNSLSNQYVSTPHGQESRRVAHFNNESQVTRGFGISPLKPERSENYNFAIALRPLSDFSITLNAYQITIRDRIIITGRFAADLDPAFEEILAPIGVGQAQFFSNAVDTKTRGIETSMRYQIQLGPGRLDLTMMGSYNATRLKRDRSGQVVVRTTDILNGYESTLFNREEVSRLESAQPNDKIILGIAYGLRKFDFILKSTRYGTVDYIHPQDGDFKNWTFDSFSNSIKSRDQRFGVRWITDISTTWYISDGLSVSVGGNNIFSIYPDRHDHSRNNSNGLFPYSRRVQQFGLRGAFWYGQVAMRF